MDSFDLTGKAAVVAGGNGGIGLGIGRGQPMGGGRLTALTARWLLGCSGSAWRRWTRG